MLATTTISTKGQLVIPKKLRLALNFNEGDTLILTVRNGHLIVSPESSFSLFLPTTVEVHTDVLIQSLKTKDDSYTLVQLAQTGQIQLYCTQKTMDAFYEHIEQHYPKHEQSRLKRIYDLALLTTRKADTQVGLKQGLHPRKFLQQYYTNQV